MAKDSSPWMCTLPDNKWKILACKSRAWRFCSKGSFHITNIQLLYMHAGLTCSSSHVAAALVLAEEEIPAGMHAA